MDLRESPEDLAFRAEVREFVAKNLPAGMRERVLGFRRVPREDYVTWQRILHAKGWAAPGWPVQYGGTGWNARQRSIFDEECYVGGAPRQLPFGLSMLGPVLMKFGTPGQLARYLPRILDLQDWWCQGYSEPGAGSDLASLKTRAERRGDVYVVNGQKTWTTLAHYANMFFCLVRTNAEGKPQQGISFLLIDMKTPGLEVRPIKTLDQGADVNEVFLDNVEVPVENLVGEEHRGWAIAKYLLGHERTNIAGIGMCKRLLSRLKDLAARETKRGKRLIEDARFREKVARLEIQVLSHEWSLMRVISFEQAGRDVSTEASMLKIRGSEIQMALGALLMECSGPNAVQYSPEWLEAENGTAMPGGAQLAGLAAQYFDLRKVAIYGGTNEVQRNIIARSVVGI